jgi:hypothetical protein
MGVQKFARYTPVLTTLETWNVIHLLHLLAEDVNNLTKKWRKKTWMKNDFEYRSYYFMSSSEAHPSKGSHMTPLCLMG